MERRKGIMPCIQIKTNQKTAGEKADRIKTGLGSIISMFPGKTEEWLMVTIEDNCQIYFGGQTGRPMAMVEVKLLGNAIDPIIAGKVTEKITKLLEEILKTAPQDIYIKYEASQDWGWNGVNF